MIFSKKILCLGNNSEDTDTQTSKIAADNLTENHGLIDDFLFIPTKSGYYHTSLMDIDSNNLISLAEKFDEILIVDQTIQHWQSQQAYEATIELAEKLTKIKSVSWLNSSMIGDTPNLIFKKILKENKSFCMMPFMHRMISHDYDNPLCCHDRGVPTKTHVPLADWITDPIRNDIRQKMIEGVQIPDRCYVCYRTESVGMTSQRISRTVYWVNRLGIKSLDELKKFNNPISYDVRTSNLCNLQCRMCSPRQSNRIEKEYKAIGIIDKYNQKYGYEEDHTYEKLDFSSIDIDTVQHLHVVGGEPTINPQFYKFLESCIEKNKTDFEIIVVSNAVKINSKIKKLFKHFTNLKFDISLEGYDKINYYIRWPGDWDSIIKNVDDLIAAGHGVTFTTVLQLYNITNSYLLFKFLEDKYPDKLASFFLVNPEDEYISPFIFPNPKPVLDNLNKMLDLKIYRNNPVFRETVDSLITHYQQEHSIEYSLLKEFFEFNDKLDQSRNIRLKDYIPELEDCRKLCYNIDYEQ